MIDLERHVRNASERVQRIFWQIVGGRGGFNYPDDSAREVAKLIADLEERIEALEKKC